MRKTMPVRECMSRLPAEVDRHETLSAVLDHMHVQRCHHVPVMDGPRLFGILSSHDLLDHAVRAGPASRELLAGDVCTQGPLRVEPMAPIVEVARAMVEHHVSSALVTEGDVLVGIFTTNDALRLISQL